MGVGKSAPKSWLHAWTLGEFLSCSEPPARDNDGPNARQHNVLVLAQSSINSAYC